MNTETTNERILWVDEEDRLIGSGEKLDTHVRRLLHRAFSVFIYDRNTGRMLIHRRALEKYHSGGLWTNACCSHPREGESMEASIHNRLLLELGLDVPVVIFDDPQMGFDAFVEKASDEFLYCGKFRYSARFADLSEEEIDRVFLYAPAAGIAPEEICPNPEEMCEVKWIALPELTARMQERPEEFTAWVGRAYALVMKHGS